MATPIELAILRYVAERTDANLAEMDRALMAGELQVPIAAPVSSLGGDVYDLPLICIRTPSGEGAIVAFTTEEQLLLWKPQGCEYASVSGHALVGMAQNMPGIAEIMINPLGVPRGSISRSQFDRLLAIT